MQYLWEQLQQETRPIVLYGMGDGAEKILRVCAQKNIVIRGIFASDDFVRYNQFCGFTVSKLSDLQAQLGEDVVILIAFASQLPELLNFFAQLDAKHTVYAPDVPVIGGGLFDRDFARTHADKLQQVYDLLADDTSKQVLEDVVHFKLTGQIGHLAHCRTDKREIFENVLKPTQNEHFCDLGAYNGDTIRELLGFTQGAFASITALEPDRRNFKKLSTYAQTLTGAVQLEQAGAWAQDTVLTFAAKAGRNSALTAKQGIETQMRAVDSVLGNRVCTYLKMDVEGAEHQAVLGATQTLQQHAPKLNIACYHRNEDLFDLPLLIHEINPTYQLYLRHHPYVPAWDVNLYAVAQDDSKV